MTICRYIHSVPMGGLHVPSCAVHPARDLRLPGRVRRPQLGVAGLQAQVPRDGVRLPQGQVSVDQRGGSFPFALMARYSGVRLPPFERSTVTSSTAVFVASRSCTPGARWGRTGECRVSRGHAPARRDRRARSVVRDRPPGQRRVLPPGLRSLEKTSSKQGMLSALGARARREQRGSGGR